MTEDLGLIPIRRALLSVSDKSQLIDLAKALADNGVELISTGGTARAIEEAGLPVTPIDAVTEFPEMMDGRVKTLHPRVHGGLLALRDNPQHVQAMTEHGIQPIDLVCVNLYPFEQTVAQPRVTEAEAIEQIDIGGPSMVRSAAKNHRFVTILTDPGQYDDCIKEIAEHNGATTLALRKRLCCAAFAKTAAYDTAIADWMSRNLTDNDRQFPASLLLRLDLAAELRYGENPHQAGALYMDPRSTEPSVGNAEQLHGKQLSFNNLYDANGALELVKEIDARQLAAVAVIKHANPCGFAVDDDVAVAFEKAYSGDPLAAFGGIVAFNTTVTQAAAELMAEGQKFLEVVVAPDYEDQAINILSERWKNVRLLKTGPLPTPAERFPAELDCKRITGGLLIQQRDLKVMDPDHWQHKAGPAPDATMQRDMLLGMIAVKHLKSNAVCLINNHMLVGAGAGQMDRLASCRIAIDKAEEWSQGAIAASDAFFPFRDGPDQLIAAGVKAIVQPGGSMRDDQTIQACNDAGVTLVFTGSRHFRH